MHAISCGYDARASNEVVPGIFKVSNLIQSHYREHQHGPSGGNCSKVAV